MGNINRILKIEVPVQVKLAERRMFIGDVIELAPGAVIQFERPYDSPLELMANEHVIASGTAVKVNEHFGLRIVSLVHPTRPGT